MKMYTESDITKFYTKVAVAGPSDCWEWLGRRDATCYGHFQFNGKPIGAHRFAWWFSTGIWPGDLYVLHRCDNKACCNPAHLFLGTQKDNIQDAVRKGRMAHGERSARAKLTEEEVYEIRDRYAAGGISQEALGWEYGVKQAHISDIVRRKSWAHI